MARAATENYSWKLKRLFFWTKDLWWCRFFDHNQIDRSRTTYCNVAKMFPIINWFSLFLSELFLLGILVCRWTSVLLINDVSITAIYGLKNLKCSNVYNVVKGFWVGSLMFSEMFERGLLMVHRLSICFVLERRYDEVYLIKSLKQKAFQDQNLIHKYTKNVAFW